MPVEHIVIPVQAFLENFLPQNIEIPPGRRNIFQHGAVGVSDVVSKCASFENWCEDMQLPYTITTRTCQDGLGSTLSVLEKDLATGTRSLNVSVPQLAWFQAVTIFEECNSRDDEPEDDEEPQDASEAFSRQLDSLLDRQKRHVLRLFRYQHRRYIQTAVVGGTRMRFVHWDRAGTVVSEDFDYIDDPEPLVTFFYLLLSGGRLAQGYDGSVTPAASHHIVKLEGYFPKDGTTEQAKSELLLAKQEILGETEADRFLLPVQCIICSDVSYRHSGVSDRKRTNAYLIGKPRSATNSTAGRGTRAYAAYDVDHNELVLLKDCWCSVESGLPNELAVYEALFTNDVRFVATALAGGFVETQSTMAHLIQKTQLYHRLEERRHYRLILKQIGRPLWLFLDSREFVSAVYDALIGHNDAYEKAKILHRDISADNIVIDIVTGRGVLVDWDHSVGRDDDSGSGRVGTWTYMSAAILRWPNKPNSLADDLESFYWSIVLPTFRYIVHIFSMAWIEDGKSVIDPKTYKGYISGYVEATFHSSNRSKGHMFGGHSKYIDLCDERGHRWRLIYDSGPLATLLRRLHALLREYYTSLDEDAMEEKYGAPKGFWRPNVMSAGRTYGPISDCLDTHTRFRTIFTDILDDPSWEWTEERTVDQLAYAFPKIYGSTSDSYDASSDDRANESSKRAHSSSSEVGHDSERVRVERYSGLFGQEYDPEVFGPPRGRNIGR